MIGYLALVRQKEISIILVIFKTVIIIWLCQEIKRKRKNKSSKRKRICSKAVMMLEKLSNKVNMQKNFSF